MKRLLILLMLGTSLLILAGCGQKANTEEPPQIAYGQDVCDQCSMIISEEKFAAAYWTAEGEARRFDDIGGMFAYKTRNPEEVASYWVHDLPTGEWIRAEEAYFVLDKDLMTPMGFGIAACAEKDQAHALAYGKEGVEVVSFTEMVAMNAITPPEMDDANGMDDGHEHEEHTE